MSKFIKLVVSTFVLLALITSGAIPSSALNSGLRATSQGTKLTDTGELAIKQLRSCLAETPVLNAYYLIDESGSMFGELYPDASDPSYQRIPILQNSMEELSKLADTSGNLPISVNYAAGFFGDNFTADIPWSPLTQENLDAKKDELSVRIQSPDRRMTNWTAGLEGAQQQLANPPEVGCSLLIWLTDGEINVRQGVEASFQALADLCGKPVNGYEPSSTPGLLASMREQKITVIGVLLDPAQVPSERKAWMQSLVESTNSEGQNPCGNGKITKSERAGAFINASSTNDLAFQFLRLGAVVSGGADGVINPDGTFTIDPGVTQFKILSQVGLENLQLLSPSGKSVDLSSVAKNSGGATSIQISISEKNQYGKWKLVGAEGSSNSLLLFADLRIRPTGLSVNPENTKGMFKLAVAVGNESLQNIDMYEFTVSATTSVNGKSSEIASFSSSEVSDGTAVIKVSNPSQLADVRFRIKNLKVGDQLLSEKYRTIDFSQYPSLVTNYDFGISRGHNQPAQGTVTLFGPSASDGLVCSDSKSLNPTVIADDANRKNWDIKAAGLNLDQDGCFVVKQGTKTEVPLQISNSKSANSKDVELALPLHVSNAAGDAPLKSQVDIKFSTQMINNPFVYWAVIAFLILLVLLIPLLVMYLINRFTTKIEHGDDVVRAVIPAQFTTKDDNIIARNAVSYDYNTALDKLEKPQELFKMQSPQKDAKSITDSEVGTFKAVIPVMPFRSPWFELIAPSGFIALTGKTPTRLQENRYKLGNRAPFGGQVSRTWVALVKEDDLLRAGDDPIDGKIVIFDKRGRGGSDRPKQRLLEVQHEAKLSSRLSNIRTALQTAKPKKAKEFTPPPAESQGPTVPPMPPMPGGSVPGAVPPPPPGNKPMRPSVGGASSAPRSTGFPPAPPTGPGSIPPPPPLPGKR